MARSIPYGFRLNVKEDADLIHTLDNVKDKTQEIKRLMRLGAKLSSGEYTIVPIQQVHQTAPVQQAAPPAPLVEQKKEPAHTPAPQKTYTPPKEKKLVFSEEQLLFSEPAKDKDTPAPETRPKRKKKDKKLSKEDIMSNLLNF